MSDDVNSFLCKKCDMRFPTRYTLVEHKKSADDHYHCRRCDLDFDSKEDLSKHFAEASFPIRSLENASACALCSQAFLDLVDLQRHVQFRHAHACGICMHDFHAGWVLQRHLSSGHALSGVPLNSPSQVASPTAESQRAPTYQRPSNSFRTDLSRNNISCPVCNFTVRSAGELAEHQRRPVHFRRPLGERLNCIVCRRSFDNEVEFDHHGTNAGRQFRSMHENCCWRCHLLFHTPDQKRVHDHEAHAIPVLPSRMRNLGPVQPRGAPGVTPFPINSRPVGFNPRSAPFEGARHPSWARPNIQSPPILNSPTMNTESPPILNTQSPPVLEMRIGNVNLPFTVRQPSPQIQEPRPIQAMSVAVAVVENSDPSNIPIQLPMPIPSTQRRPWTRPIHPCGRCNVRFTSVQEQSEHLSKPFSLLRYCSETGLTCDRCGGIYPSIDDFKQHILELSVSHNTACAACLCYFHNPRGLQDHIKNSHGVRPSAPEGELQTGTIEPDAPHQAAPNVKLPPASRLYSSDRLPISQPLSLQLDPPCPSSSVPSQPSSASTPSPVPRFRQIRIQDFSDSEEDGEGFAAFGNGEDDPWNRDADTSSSDDGLRLASYAFHVGAVATGRDDNVRSVHLRAPRRMNRRTEPQPNLPTELVSSEVTPTTSDEKPHVLRPRKAKPKKPGKGPKQAGFVKKEEVAPGFHCPCCLDPPVQPVSTVCGHVACRSCMEQSLKLKPECPVCRATTFSGQLRALYI